MSIKFNLNVSCSKRKWSTVLKSAFSMGMMIQASLSMEPAAQSPEKPVAHSLTIDNLLPENLNLVFFEFGVSSSSIEPVCIYWKAICDMYNNPAYTKKNQERGYITWSGCLSDLSPRMIFMSNKLCNGLFGEAYSSSLYPYFLYGDQAFTSKNKKHDLAIYYAKLALVKAEDDVAATHYRFISFLLGCVGNKEEDLKTWVENKETETDDSSDSDDYYGDGNPIYWAFSNAKKYGEALRYALIGLEKGVDEDKKANLKNIARTYKNLKQPAEALHHMLLAFEEAGEDVDIGDIMDVSQFFKNAGFQDESKSYLDFAIRKVEGIALLGHKKDTVIAYSDLASKLFDADEYELAACYSKMIIKLKGEQVKAKYYANAYLALSKAGHPEEAADYLNLAIKKVMETNNKCDFQKIAKCLFKTRNYEEAARYMKLNLVFTVDWNRSGYFLDLAKYLTRADKYNEAIPYITQLIEISQLAELRWTMDEIVKFLTNAGKISEIESYYEMVRKRISSLEDDSSQEDCN